MISSREYSTPCDSTISTPASPRVEGRLAPLGWKSPRWILKWLLSWWPKGWLSQPRQQNNSLVEMYIFGAHVCIPVITAMPSTWPWDLWVFRSRSRLLNCDPGVPESKGFTSCGETLGGQEWSQLSTQWLVQCQTNGRVLENDYHTNDFPPESLGGDRDRAFVRLRKILKQKDPPSFTWRSATLWNRINKNPKDPGSGNRPSSQPRTSIWFGLCLLSAHRVRIPTGQEHRKDANYNTFFRQLGE